MSRKVYISFELHDCESAIYVRQMIRLLLSLVFYTATNFRRTNLRIVLFSSLTVRSYEDKDTYDSCRSQAVQTVKACHFARGKTMSRIDFIIGLHVYDAFNIL